MNEEYMNLANLPGRQGKQTWLLDKLERLSVWESRALTALTQRRPPNTAEDMVNRVLALQGCSVYLAPDGYESLGERELRRMGGSDPEELLPHADLYALGTRFEDQHPGLFVGNCFVAYPLEDAPVYRGRDSPLPGDDGWSVRLKLASPAVPEGVWLRLPDYRDLDADCASDGESALAKDALRVQSLNECTLLDAECVLPEAGDIKEQYDSIEDLVFDGNSLGIILDERGQGTEYWIERFAAALEYENCRKLRLALDISQNLHCYDWVSCEMLEEFALDHLRSCGVSEELIQSGSIDLTSYAEDLLENSGYMLTGDESAYVTRNAQTFSYSYSMEAETPAAPKNDPAQEENILPEDILSASPPLADLAANLSPEETLSVNAALRESLSGRGPDGLRQLEAAMDFEDCASLGEAVEIAAHLDCYKFMGISICDEAARQELLNKGLDDWVIEQCFNLSAYAAISHGFDDLYTSEDTGLYVHKSDLSFQLAYWREKTGPIGPSM